MGTTDDLKEALEELSEQELTNFEILKRVADLVDELDTSTINSMPVLYRIEIKKALEKLDREKEASKIQA